MKFNRIYRAYYRNKIIHHFKMNWWLYVRVLIFTSIVSFVGDRLNVWYFKPAKLYTLLDRLFYDYAKEHPEVLTKTKFFKWPYITPGMEGHLNDVSIFQEELDVNYSHKEFEFLERYNQDELSKSEQFSAAIFKFIIEDEILENDIYSGTVYAIDHINGIQVQLPMFMINNHEINSITDANNYIHRLEEVQDKVSELISGNRLHPTESEQLITTKNILFRRKDESLEDCIHHFHINEQIVKPPQSILRRVEEQLVTFLDVPLEKNIIYQDFLHKIESSDDERVRKNIPELKYGIKRALEGAVIPSFDALRRTVTELIMQQAPSEITVMQYDLGVPYYQQRLKRTLGFNDQTIDYEYRPQIMYNLGKKLVYREKKKLRSLFQEAGIEEGTTLKEKAEIYFKKNNKNASLGVDLYIADFIQVFSAAPQYFADEKQVEYYIQPSILDGVSIEPFYFDGSFDYSRKSKIYFSDSISIYTQNTLQPTALSMAAEHQWKGSIITNTSLPLFRRNLAIPFMEEFWKNVYLYNYFIKASLDQRIAWTMWRLQNAIYMETDLGIHNLLWTRTEAVGYVFNNSLLSERDSEKIVDQCAGAISENVACGMAMYITDLLVEEGRISVDNQLNKKDLKYLFNEGGVLFEQFKEIMFVNKDQN
ncbi:DUF885 domain-containing protein [Flammeovirga kamogawensis]|nr:DUF885 domain-containing protein [Flammeovirga kamogawensis]